MCVTASKSRPPHINQQQYPVKCVARGPIKSTQHLHVQFVGGPTRAPTPMKLQDALLTSISDFADCPRKSGLGCSKHYYFLN
jgi:hypothetical protein